MKHYDDDTLLKASLKILDSGEYRKVLKHLESCEECRAKYSAIAEDNKVIASYEPDGKPLTASRLPERRTFKLRILNAAAILMIGFGLGYVTGFANKPPPVNVSQQKLVTRTLSADASGFIHNEMLDLNIDFGF